MALSDTKIIVCPACATSNRVPVSKLAAGGKCGRCRSPLFLGQPIDLTSANFEAHAVRSDIPLLVDFWASWCGPCLQMAPAFTAAAGQLEPHLRLAKLDTQAEQAIAERYQIRSIPTMIAIAKGRELGRKSGAMSTRAIIDWANYATEI